MNRSATGTRPWPCASSTWNARDATSDAAARNARKPKGLSSTSRRGASERLSARLSASFVFSSPSRIKGFLDSGDTSTGSSWRLSGAIPSGKNAGSLAACARHASMIRAWSSRRAGASLFSRDATSVPANCFLSSSLHINGMGSWSRGSRRKYGHHADASPRARSYITAKMSAASSRSARSSSGTASETEPVRGVRHQAFGISTSTSPTRTSADANAALLTRVEPGGVTSRSSRAACSMNPRSTHHFSNAASEPASPRFVSSAAAVSADSPVALARSSPASAAAGALARLRDLGGMRTLA